MGLDVELYYEVEPGKDVIVYNIGISHNLVPMAKSVNLYNPLWKGEDITEALDLINPVTRAIVLLKECPNQYRRLQAKNKWGTYDQFIEFLQNLLKALIEYPHAKVNHST